MMMTEVNNTLEDIAHSLAVSLFRAMEAASSPLLNNDAWREKTIAELANDIHASIRLFIPPFSTPQTATYSIHWQRIGEGEHVSDTGHWAVDAEDMDRACELFRLKHRDTLSEKYVITHIEQVV